MASETSVSISWKRSHRTTLLSTTTATLLRPDYNNNSYLEGLRSVLTSIGGQEVCVRRSNKTAHSSHDWLTRLIPGTFVVEFVPGRTHFYEHSRKHLAASRHRELKSRKMDRYCHRWRSCRVNAADLRSVHSTSSHVTLFVTLIWVNVVIVTTEIMIMLTVELMSLTLYINVSL